MPRGDGRIKFADQVPANFKAEDLDAITPATISIDRSARLRGTSSRRSMSRSRSVDRAVTSMFVLGSRDEIAASKLIEPDDIASLSRDELGGIEYRALRTLLPVATGE